MTDTLKILIPIVIAHIVVLVAVVFVIKRLLLSDTMNAVQRIQQVEADVRKREEGIRREIEEHEREFTRKKADAETEIQRHREEGEKEVARMREQVLEDARTEGDRLIEQAKKNEQKFREQLAQDIEERAVEYGGEVFRLVFSDKMNEVLNRQFIDELLDALAEVDGSTITIDSGSAEFIASHPLPAEQKQRLETLLAERFGVNVKVEEKLQPDLMAGLILKLGSLEIDGSLLNRYREAVAEVKKNARA